MSGPLLKALIALVPGCMLFFGSMVLFLKGRNLSSFLQLLGTTCLTLVVLAHVAEGLHLFPWMGWGLEQSAGHYLDLSSAVVVVTSFPIGYLLYALKKRYPRGQPSP